MSNGLKALFRFIGEISWLGWFVVIVLIAFAVSQCGEAIDWIDRRHCRTGGGRVVEADRHGEWRCVSVTPERAP
ncbi:MAG TPA: hypothetical protein VFQ42_21925 [Mycobacterium sp.]|nr:hypothetical protein [Mycobacterium sp.]